MIESTELLQSYLEGVSRLTGAAHVSLFVPESKSARTRPQLLGTGVGEPTPELRDLAEAVKFVSEATEVGADGAIASREESAVLLPLYVSRSAGDPAEEAPSRRQEDRRTSNEAQPPVAWLGLRFDQPIQIDPSASLAASLEALWSSTAGEARVWQWVRSMGGALSVHASEVASILRDPITGLANRAGFMSLFSQRLARARDDETEVGLLLINPDGFATINERFGREAGDRVVRAISKRLRGSLRASDTVARYGGVIFAVILESTKLEDAIELASKLRRRLAEAAFLDGAVRMGFSVGIAVSEADAPGVRSPLDLIRRADQALNRAKRQGGDQVVEWEQEAGIEEAGNFDRLSGIFTGNLSKDYRNMILLSDAIDVIAASSDFQGLVSDVVEKLYSTFQADRVGLLGRDEDGRLVSLRGITRRARGEASSQLRVEAIELTPTETALVERAIEEAEPQEHRAEKASGSASVLGRRVSYAVPVRTSRETIGCLFFAGPEETLLLEGSDLIFLKALASQLAVALDRARLSELERGRTELVRKQLQAELNDLRQAVQQSRMVYRSSEMEAVVSTARRVAPTDATVLITGESGTGKELLARTLHQLSERRKGPLVVVDCGAIPSSLIESELFGHEKGAFTGAQQRRRGQLSQAEGGTVLLDEIGELPLEVQAKLLRFVQEKQFTPVGGSRPEEVDVRIVAATNRDLAREVADGRFREDLYYRLNVVRLGVPPLRERPEDVLHLARYFLELYVVQYQKTVRLGSEAEEALWRYRWPGNVRELQNRMMQAVILSESEVLAPADLGLEVPSQSDGWTAGSSAPASRVDSSGEFRVGADRGSSTSDASDAWSDLRRALSAQIDRVAEGRPLVTVPLGNWLGEDLVLAAAAVAGSNGRKAAAILGVPGTTFRRRWQKAHRKVAAGLAARPEGWDSVRSSLAQIVRLPEGPDEDLTTRAEQILLVEILERYPTEVGVGSELLGVSSPTYRRRIAALPKSD